MLLTRSALSLAALFALLVNASAEEEFSRDDLSPLLAAALETSPCPSIAAAVVKGDKIVAAGASGLRKIGGEVVVGLDDQYHLGSCTKPMTATLAAILVEDGLIKWDSSIGEILSDQVLPDLHPKHRQTTLEQLLAHTGGLSTNPPMAAWGQAWTDQGTVPAREQRRKFCQAILSQPPAYKAGSKTKYSNQGYAIAGLMLETVTDTPWEELITKRLFQPLDMRSAGFRAPQGDNPLGHRGQIPVEPGPGSDNPDAIGPAGTVHANIVDWAKFARFHLQREVGTLLQDPASFDKLHSLLPNSGKHGVGGWLVHDIEAMGGHCIQMVGSNTMWMAVMWILPEKEIAVLVTTNTASKDAFPLCDRVASQLIGKYQG